MKPVSRGYRMATPDSANAVAWTVEPAEGEPYENMPVIKDWSYFQPIDMSVRVRVDLESLLSSSGSATDARVGLALSWRTKTVGRSGTGTIEPIESSEVTALARAPRGMVGGTLIMEAKIVLIEPGIRTSSPYAPVEPGSVLWESMSLVTLEGTAPRLAISVVAAGLPPFAGDKKARWLVSVNHSDLSLPVDVTVRVSLNEANPRIVAMVQNPESEASAVLLSSLVLDLNRELVRSSLLLVEDFEPADAGGEDPLYPEGSLGAAMAAILGLWPDDVDALRARAEYDWAELDVDIQKYLSNEANNGRH